MNEEEPEVSAIEQASASLEQGLEKCQELVSECRSKLLALGDPRQTSLGPVTGESADEAEPS